MRHVDMHLARLLLELNEVCHFHRETRSRDSAFQKVRRRHLALIQYAQTVSGYGPEMLECKRMCNRVESTPGGMFGVTHETRQQTTRKLIRLHPLTKLSIDLWSSIHHATGDGAHYLSCYGGLWTVAEIAAELEIAPIPEYALGRGRSNIAYCVHGEWAYETLKQSRHTVLSPLQKSAVLEATYVY